jgi:hypothetical protein
VTRLLGGEAAETRRAQWGRDGKISIVLLYLLALAGMVIVFLVLLVACRPAEPPPDALPSEAPSQRYIAEWPDPDERIDSSCRCADREPIPDEDPRLLP